MGPPSLTLRVSPLSNGIPIANVYPPFGRLGHPSVQKYTHHSLFCPPYRRNDSAPVGLPLRRIIMFAISWPQLCALRQALRDDGEQTYVPRQHAMRCSTMRECKGRSERKVRSRKMTRADRLSALAHEKGFDDIAMLIDRK